MVNIINSNKFSHFKSVIFIFMILNTVLNVFVIASVSYAYQYAGLLFSVIFFLGLIGLSLSKYAVGSHLNPHIFLLCLLPECINLVILDPANDSLLLFAATLLVLASSPRVNSRFSQWLVPLAISALGISKAGELGMHYGQLLQSASYLALLTALCNLIIQIFSVPSEPVSSGENDRIDTDQYLSDLRYKIDPNFYYRFKLKEGEYLTQSMLRPLELIFPFLQQNAHRGTDSMIPSIRIITHEGLPSLEANNIQISASQQEMDKICEQLSSVDFYWYDHPSTPNSFMVASSAAAQYFNDDLTQEATVAPSALENEPDESPVTNAALPVSNDELVQELVEDSNPDVETAASERTINTFDSSFKPAGGRPLTNIRRIDPEGGTADFQWNVPSK